MLDFISSFFSQTSPKFTDLARQIAEVNQNDPCLLLFSAHIWNTEGKSSIQDAEIGRFSADLPIDNVRLLVVCLDCFDFENFVSPVISNLP